MMALLLAKDDDFSSWRGIEEFSTAFRDAAVRLASQRHPDGIARMLELLEGQFAAVEQENMQLAETLDRLLNDLSGATEPSELRRLLTAWHDCSYRHFIRFGSPSALFSMSAQLLDAFAARCLQLTADQLGQHLPPVALFAFGPAGRREPTRYCRLQLGLIWDGGPAAEAVTTRLGEELTAWFRVCGIPLEEHVTPLQQNWRGSLEQWETRLERTARKEDKETLIELLRLADRTSLVGQGSVAASFDSLCSQYLGSRRFVGNLVERCASLSNGISMMGGLRLEKTGPHRGSFALLDHALLPLAAAVSAICLMHRIETAGTPQRLRELVRRSKIDVVLAERALHAWHCFTEHQLALESTAASGQDFRDIMHLPPARLSEAELERLISGLETVGDLQRYMQVCFGSYR